MTIDIEQILRDERLVVHLQPIVSPNGRVFFGMESLIRGIADDGGIIVPHILFGEAAKRGFTLELDKIARTLAIRAFAPLYEENNKLILFVNFEPSLIDNFEPGNYLFYGELKKLGIPYENVVLEVKEDEISDTAKLKLFCDHYRALGFNIALDDFGVGQSSFDRIAVVRPDIIKIDRSLITDISNNQIHREIVSAICKMCHNIGAMPLAEGGESIEEIVCCMRLGASLIQGFYIARPSAEVTENKLRQKVSDVNEAYSKILKNMQLEEKRFHEMGEEAESLFCSFVANAQNIKNWTQSGSRLLEELPSVEALYLIDDENKQVGDTLIKSRTRPFYEPTKDGYDYSLKEYYIRAKNAISGKHLTEPYLSLASGSLCRTYASRISISQTSYVLCIDFAIGN
jgi:EAL domain-containing protein (putative c-di-GMP-specific phosphodiesterase class I)